MSRNKVVAILVSIVACAIAFVMWQRQEPPRPMAAPLTGAASPSPTDKPNLGKIGN